MAKLGAAVRDRMTPSVKGGVCVRAQMQPELITAPVDLARMTQGSYSNDDSSAMESITASGL